MSISSGGYALIKKEIGDLLLHYGFLPYKSATFYTITPDAILQFLTFQKGVQSLSDQMTINIVVQALFSPTCSFLVGQPGGRIGQFMNTSKDKWWYCNDEKSTLASIADIKNDLTTTVLPLLQQNMSDPGQLITTFSSDKYRFLWQGQNTFIDQGYIYLKGGRYTEGLNIFSANRPSKVPRFKTIQNWVEQLQFDRIDNLLQENIKSQKAKWKI